MKAEAQVFHQNIAPMVVITHKNERLQFSITVYRRKVFQMGFDVFGHINAYWAQLPEATQDLIFQQYLEIFEAFDAVSMKEDIGKYIHARVIKLLSLHDPYDVQMWQATKATDIVMPDRIPTEYVHSIDNNTSEDKTYTRPAYVQLITMATIFRVLLPIFGEYISSIRQKVDNINKEKEAFRLLAGSNLENYPAMKKLEAYIRTIIASSGGYNPANTLNGTPEEDFPRLMQSIICVRLLPVADIRGNDPVTHLVSYIHIFVGGRIDNKDTSAESMVRTKDHDKESSDLNNQSSYLERYRVKGNLSVGDVIELETAMNNIEYQAQRLTTLVTKEQVLKCIETSKILHDHRVLEPQVTLLRWVFKPIVPSKSIYYLSLPTIIRSLGALEAVLWARGHKYLSILSTCYSITSERDMVVSPVDGKNHIPKDMVAELDKYYPFKPNPGYRKSGVSDSNFAIEAIDTLANDLAMFSWRPTCSEDKLIEVFGSRARRFVIRPDIRTDLAKLVLEIASRSYI